MCCGSGGRLQLDHHLHTRITARHRHKTSKGVLKLNEQLLFDWSLLQISVFYNIPVPPEVKTLSLEVSESANCASTAARATMDLEIKTG